MGWEIREMGALVLTALALLGLRAIAAALESSLVAVGLPRAQELAAEGGSERRARALVSLLDDHEATAFTGRALATVATLLAGFVAGFAGAALAPGARWWGGLGAALLAAVVSLPLAAARRRRRG